MKRVILFVLVLISIFTFGFSIEEELKKFIETVNASFTVYDRKFQVLKGYFEGKFTDLETSISEKFTHYDKKLQVLEFTLLKIQETLQTLNHTLESFYKNDELIADSLKVLKDEVLTLRKRTETTEKELEVMKKEKETYNLILYGTLALSILNTFLIVVLVFLK